MIRKRLTRKQKWMLTIPLSLLFFFVILSQRVYPEGYITFFPNNQGTNTGSFVYFENNEALEASFSDILVIPKTSLILGERVTIDVNKQGNYDLLIEGNGFSYLYFGSQKWPVHFTPVTQGNYQIILRDESGTIIDSKQVFFDSVKNKTETIFSDDTPQITNKTNDTILDDQELFVQGSAEVGKPVNWKKTVKVRDDFNDNKRRLIIEGIDKRYEAVHLRKILPSGMKTAPNRVVLDYTYNIKSKDPDTETIALLVSDQENDYEVIYQTEAPRIYEEKKNDYLKEITVSSAFHYEDVLAYTAIDEVREDAIKLFWIKEGKRTLFKEVNYHDENNNGLIDKLSWRVPHLSNQTFEVEITILNVQSFPIVGGNWTVFFNTTGVANLSITTLPSTTWAPFGQQTEDLEFLELRCGNQVVSHQWINNTVFVQDYSCNETSAEISRVHTPGKHELNFSFGGQSAIARNLAGDISIVGEWGFTENIEEDVWMAVNFNHTFNDVPVLVHYAVYNYSYDDNPCQTRIQNVNLTGFEIRVESWDSGTEDDNCPSTGVHAYWLGMEKGIHNISSNGEYRRMVEVVNFTMSSSACGSGANPSDWSYTANHRFFQHPWPVQPLVLASVQTVNDNDPITWYARACDTTNGNPWNNTCVEIGTNGLENDGTGGAIQPCNIHTSDEEGGYIAWEMDTAFAAAESRDNEGAFGNGSHNYYWEAYWESDNVGGSQDDVAPMSSYFVTLSQSWSEGVGFWNPTEMDGANGWFPAVFYNQSDRFFLLADEDQHGDAEQSHAAFEPGVVLFFNTTSGFLFSNNTDPDVTAPQWFANNSNPESPVNRLPGLDYRFNVTWTDDLNITIVLIQHNFTGGGGLINTTVNLTNGSDYSYVFSDIPAGVYTWMMIANDSGNNLNQTDPYIYNIVPDTVPPQAFNNTTGPPTLSGYALGQNYTFNITWTDDVNVSAVIIQHNLTGSGGLINNTINQSNGNEYYYVFSHVVPGVYTWMMIANDTTNNVNQSIDRLYQLNQGNPIHLLLNDQEHHYFAEANETINITVYVDDGSTVELFQDGQLINEGVPPLQNITSFPAHGNYNFTVVSMNNSQNFTASTQSYFVIIEEDPVPSLHAVTGFVFEDDGSTQVPSGTIVRINLSEDGATTEVNTSGPPGNTGFYGAIINTTDGENITITSFNETAYARAHASLLDTPSVTRVNLSMNLTRPPEVQTVILSPGNVTVHDQNSLFNVTLNVTAIGGSDSENCNVSLVIENQSVFNLTSGYNFTNELGNISLASSVLSIFQFEALSGGTSTLTFTSLCSTDQERIENLHIATTLQIIAAEPPQLHTVQGYVFLSDNTTQVPTGTNVTVNATVTGTLTLVETSGPPGHTGFYSAIINASDGELVTVTGRNATHKGNETIALLNAPSVTLVNITLDTLLLADLTTNETLIVFGNYTPLENENVSINASIENIGEGAAFNVTVQFYRGDPNTTGQQLGENQSIDFIGYNDSLVVNITFIPNLGPNEIFVLIDSNNTVNETNETNNQANRTYHMSAYQELFGTLFVDRFIGENDTQIILNWTNITSAIGNIYVTDVESNNGISFLSLHALSKNESNASVSDDLANVDTLLNMTGFNDSIANRFSDDGNTPHSFFNFTVFNKEIFDVPVINSTNTSNFRTGILWDVSDDGSNNEFDTTDQEDLVFVTALNHQTQGAFGIYDYEISYPVLLREYNQTDSSEVFIYFEII